MKTSHRLQNISISFILLFFSYGLINGQYQHPFQNPDLAPEARIENLLSLMTLDEKVSALSTDPSVPRLGVVGTRHIEGYHGVAMGGPANWAPQGDNRVPTTQFPQAYGMGAIWDTELMQRAGQIQALEARYIFQNPEIQMGGLVVRAPNADLGRDPRWGRTEECYGEDAFLVGALSTAFTKGLQGDHPKFMKTASLLKHFLANSNEDGRDSSSSDFDWQLFHEYYAAPFRDAIVKGGSNAYMAAYNSYNGIPAHVHPMLREITMDMWGLNGIICTDGGGYRLLVTAHKYYDDLNLAAEAIIKAGINQFLDNYREGVYGALANGYLSVADIDDVLKGVYRVMIQLGQLDPPEMVPYASIGRDGAPAPWTLNEHRETALELTEKSIVLLKNDKNLLPLKRNELKKVAVIGWLADTVLLDWYSGLPPYRISILDGIRKQVGDNTEIVFVEDNTYNNAVKAASDADVAIVVLGNNPITNGRWADSPDPGQGKEGIDRRTLQLYDEHLAQRVFEANPNTILILKSSFPYSINWSQENLPAILHIAHNGQETGSAMANVLFGEVNPGGKLIQTWPKTEKHLPHMLEYDIRKGLTYMYFDHEPLYHFGHGLSYTNFNWSGLNTPRNVSLSDEDFTVSLTLQNSGRLKGDEVVQLYVSFPDSKVKRPNIALKGFNRVTLEPGEQQSIEIPISLADLAYWDVTEEQFLVEPGTVQIMVGSASNDIKLRGRVRIR